MPCLVERAIANPETADGTQREQRDLIAQESAALWGFWIAVIAFLQLAATVIGLVFIKRTLDATRAAVKEAGDATEAAREAVKETSRVGEAQTRAYLSVVRADFHFARRGKSGLPFDLTLQFHNSGGTPAVNVSYYCGAVISTWSDSKAPPDLNTVPFQQFVTNKPPGDSPVQAVCYGIAPRWREYAKRWDEVDEDTKFGEMPQLVICGVVFYEDVFGQTFRSQFAFVFADRVTEDGGPFGRDDLPTIQGCVPTFERVGDRNDHIKVE